MENTLLPPLPDAPLPDTPLPDSPLPDAPLLDVPLPDVPLPDAPLPSPMYLNALLISLMSSVISSNGAINKLKCLQKLGLSDSTEYPSNTDFHAKIKPIVNQLLIETKQVLQMENPRHAGNRTHGKIEIFGDFHGCFRSVMLTLMNVIKINPVLREISIGDSMLVFLGDYTDRGKSGLFVLLFVFALKCLFPNQVVLLAGNHEDRTITEMYGFEREMHGRNMSDEYDFIIDDIFPLLKIFCVFGNNMFVHGGIAVDKKLYELAELRGDAVYAVLADNNGMPEPLNAEQTDAQMRAQYGDEPMEVNHLTRTQQLIWGDPNPYHPNYSRSDRSYEFKCYGTQAMADFLEEPIQSKNGESEPLKVDRVFRGHSHGDSYCGYEDGDGGSNILLDGQLIIIWSVNAYGGTPEEGGVNKEFGYGTISPTPTEDTAIWEGMKKVDRVSTDGFTYYSVNFNIQFELIDETLEKMKINMVNRMIPFWELTVLGERLGPSIGEDIITPAPSRTNSGSNA